VALLEKHPEAGMLYGPALYWHPGDAARDFVQDVGGVSETVPPPQLVPLYLARPEVTPSPSGILARREEIHRVGGFEGTFRGMYEDQVFCLKMALRTRILVAPECWYRYRQHEDSCCNMSYRQGTHAAARLEFLKWAAEYVKSCGVRDPEVDRALRRQLRAALPQHAVVTWGKRELKRLVPASLWQWLRARKPGWA
jgi:hypothetical protein